MSQNLNTEALSQQSGLVNGQIPAGEIRRKFALGNKVSKLAIDETPFFRLASTLRRETTDDPEFKQMEERPQWHRRYVYLLNQTGGNSLTNAAYWTKTNYDAQITAEAFAGLQFVADYDRYGRFKVSGNANTNYFNGADTKPIWMFENQLLKIPVSWWAGDDAAHSANEVIKENGYIIVEVTAIADVGGEDNAISVTANIIHTPGWTLLAGTTKPDRVYYGLGVPGKVSTDTSGNKLFATRDLSAAVTGNTARREDRIYIVGNGYEEGSGLPDTTWADKISDTFGYTQIFKEDFTMNNTARAMVLRGVANEWKKQWYTHVLSHKRDIEHTAFWGHKYKTTVNNNPKRYTQGVIDFITQNGFIFNMTEGKTFDDFTHDLGEFFHPEVQNQKSTIYFCSTAVFNWLNGVGTGNFVSNSVDVSSGFRSTLSVEGKKKVFGVEITDISTVQGTIHLAKNTMLDGTGIHIVAVDMKNVKYRPLVGNGLNRDTTIYMGVQSLEHTGVDKRTDLIQTEAGFDFRLGETMAIWKS